MKFLARTIIAAFISFSLCNPVFATRDNPYLCTVMLKALYKAGYNEQNTYRLDEIKAFLREAGVIPPVLNFLDPTEPYKLLYSCNYEGGVAHAKLAVQSTNPNLVNNTAVTTIMWEATN